MLPPFISAFLDETHPMCTTTGPVHNVLDLSHQRAAKVHFLHEVWM